MGSSASAAVTTERAEWYTGAAPGTTLPVGTDLEINLKQVEHTDGLNHAVFESAIGAGGAQNLKLTSTGISCTECVITNKEVTENNGAIAYGTGKVTFEGVTVDEPAGCTVSSETGAAGKITTKLLEIHADWMDPGTPTNNHAFIQFRPDNGGTVFAQFRLEKCGALGGPFNVGGSLFVESKTTQAYSLHPRMPSRAKPSTKQRVRPQTRRHRGEPHRHGEIHLGERCGIRDQAVGYAPPASSESRRR